MNLENKFLFWPVRVLGVREGWVFGTYVRLDSLPHRKLLEQRRLRWRHGKRGSLSDHRVEASFRHYDSLGIAMERVRPLLETFELDEQQFTDPVTVLPESKAQEALIEFLNLPDRDEQAAVDFINKVGCFDYLDVDDGRFAAPRMPDWLQKTCQQLGQGREPDREGNLRGKKDPFATSLAQFWAVRDDLLGLWNLSVAIREKVAEAARRQCSNRRPDSTFDPDTRWLEMAKAILRVDISIMLNSEEKPPRVFLGEKRGDSVAMTMAKTVRSGLYLALLSLISSGSKHGNCPICGSAFIETAKRKKYCRDACQNAARARRFRKRKQMQNAEKREGKNKVH